MRIPRKIWLVVLFVLPLAITTIWPSRASGDSITIATWNLEWLVTPETAHLSRLACRHHERAPMPCDVIEDLSRDSADLARLAAYARELDADIVAFQEVESEAIARMVFPGYSICMADGAGVQHVGFAVRPHLAYRCGPTVDALALDGRGRKAMSLLLTPTRGAPLELLAVHLKSGCSRDPLDSNQAACHILEQQAEKLGEWIRGRAAQRSPFMVLGDFNRVPPASDDDAFWRLVNTAPLQLLDTLLPFSNCVIGQPYSQFIDHMLLSDAMRHRLVPGSPRHRGYRSADAVRYRLSDHCPVSISLDLGDLT